MLAVLHGKGMRQVMYHPAACAIAMQAATLGVRITSDLASALPLVQPRAPSATQGAPPSVAAPTPWLRLRCIPVALRPSEGCSRAVHNLAREGHPLAQPHMAFRQRRQALSYWHLRGAMVCVVLCIHRILDRSGFGRAADTLRTRP